MEHLKEAGKSTGLGQGCFFPCHVFYFPYRDLKIKYYIIFAVLYQICRGQVQRAERPDYSPYCIIVALR